MCKNYVDLKILKLKSAKVKLSENEPTLKGKKEDIANPKDSHSMN
jgi:hypothetical protein